MAAAGLVEGSESWNQNLANIEKQQKKERRELSHGSTAMDLREKYGDAAKVDYNFLRQQAIFTGISREKQQLKGRFTKLGGGPDGGDKFDASGWAQATRNIDASKFGKRFDKQAKAQYDKGEWMREVTYQQKVGGQDSEERNLTRTVRTGRKELTAGGALKMQELMSSPENELGRPLEGWEAMAYIEHGAPDMSLSEQEQSMEKAKSAASGQKQAGRSSSEAAAAESVEQSNTSSPWVKKKETSMLG